MKTNEMIAEELGMTVEELEEMIEEEAEKQELLTAMEHGIALF
jgi:fatty acid-binding protein DegV